VVVRQVIVFVNTSVDGFMGSPSGDLGWLIHDDEMDHDFTSDLRRAAEADGVFCYTFFKGVACR
jgi:hypothetical protein